MRNGFLRNCINKYFGRIVVIILFLFCQFVSHAARNQTNGLFPSKANPNLHEIDRIIINGNKSFTFDELSSILSSRPSKRNTYHKLINYYHSEFTKIKNINRYLPPGGMAVLKQTLRRWSAEIQYYEETKAESDIENLNEFYNQNGFHDVKISYSFIPDSNDKKNVLVFDIIEGSRYKLGKISYKGFDLLGPEVMRKLQNIKTLKVDSDFMEEKIVIEINSIQQTLLNDGYYYSIFQTPTVSKDTSRKIDSVTIKFIIGKRQKISGFNFVDSTSGQGKVTDIMKERQLTFIKGDWYSKKAIEDSRQNLQSLGTFELVSIDTSSIFSEITDTTLPILVYTRYRKISEWNPGFYINKDNFVNVGLELAFIHRNLFGNAQSLNAFTRIERQNISHNPAEYEWQLGATFAQPFLWKIWNWRVGLTGQLMHSISKISSDLLFSNSSSTFNELLLSNTSFQVKFPAQLPRWTYFNALSLDFLIEWQVPSNFKKVYDNLIKLAKTDSAKQIVEENLKLYKTLDVHYDNNHWYVPTAFIVGLSVSGDTRDNFFNPTTGYLTNLSLDTWTYLKGLGIAKYSRFQYSYCLYTSLNQYTVFALKARAGYIYWDSTDSYIPAERQFYAGGANSVRGWESRKLRYLPQRIIDESKNLNLEFAENQIGSRVILEGSFEVRWRFGKPRWASDLIGDIINLGVMTGFIDWGNTYHWLAFSDDKYYQDFEFKDYLSGISVSTGIGWGILTPVGPFRIDFSFPVYDPLPFKNDSKFVLARKFNISTFWNDYIHIHFGLGYAF